MRLSFGVRNFSLRVLLGKTLATRKELSAAKVMLASASHIATSMQYAHKRLRWRKTISLRLQMKNEGKNKLPV